MVLLDIHDIGLQATTSDVVIARDIERQVLYRRAVLLSVGTKLLPVRHFGVLDVRFEFPSDMVGAYPVPEGTMADLEGITWSEFDMVLEKAQVYYDMTDESRARELQNYQQQTGRRKAAEALAELLDHHILDRIIARTHVANNVVVAPGNEWNSGGPGADPEQNVVDAVNNILSNSRVTLEGITNINMVIPAPVWGDLRKLILVGNVQQRLEDYFKTVFGLSTYPTRYTDTIAGMDAGISDDAYIVVNSDDCGLTGVFDPPPGSGIPLAEVWREHGVGERHLFTNWFRTRIQPLDPGVTDTSPYIACIQNVA